MSEETFMPKFGFRTSAEIGEIAAALVAAQAKFGAAVKDSANPAYRSKYADLSSCIEATQKSLSENGIAVLQAPQLDGHMVTITTRLQHKSGQWYESDLSLPAVQRDRFDAQSVGSAITYGRRYSLQAILNLATADDDGNAASGIGSSDAAQAVGRNKIEESKQRLGKGNGAATEPVDAIFYTYPESHSGHYAEFLNIGQFILAHQDKEDSMRLVFTAAKGKKTAGDTVLVPFDKMENLLTALAGDMGIAVKELKAHA